MSPKLKSLLNSPAVPLKSADEATPLLPNNTVNIKETKQLLAVVPVVEKIVEAPPRILTTKEAILLDDIFQSLDVFRAKYKGEPNFIVLSKEHETNLLRIKNMFKVDVADSTVTEILGMKIQYTVVPNTVMCV